MAINALGPYDFPAKDRLELFGDDQLVNVFWEGNTFICSPGCFRVPRTMTWADFRGGGIDPWAAADPDYDPASVSGWQLDGAALTPTDGASLADAGVGHKSLITFRTDGA